ncbi:MAG: alpha/beta hydrolase [Pseudobdellovibrionaceae bacterium]
MANRTDLPSIVLVHGAFVDGSGWEGVYQILKREGYSVSIVQNPTLSLMKDAEATKLVIRNLNQPVLLVGHSYGGAVITEAGNDPKVAGLVYIGAFVPDNGESLDIILKSAPPEAPQPPFLPPQDGFVFLDKAKFHASFAADVNADKAAFMADSQVPAHIDTLNEKITQAAWRSKPSWYLVTAEDKMIPPDAQRSMAKRAKAKIAEETASHSIFLSKPKAVASIIIAAAGELMAVKPSETKAQDRDQVRM